MVFEGFRSSPKDANRLEIHDASPSPRESHLRSSAFICGSIAFAFPKGALAMKMNEPIGHAEVIDFKLNGEKVSALSGETIIQAAKRHGVDIPHLCYKEGYRPDGNCRACVVEIKGERVLAPSCCRAPSTIAAASVASSI